MTTIPTHNLVIQQSGIAQEASHQARHGQPLPEQLETQQVARELQEKTTVQESARSEQAKADRERQARERRRRKKEREKREQEASQPQDSDPDNPGRLLDTVA